MKRSTTIGIAVITALCAGLALRPASRAQTSSAPVQQPATSARFAFGGNVSQVPAEFIGNLIFLPVRVNQGQPSLLELDSTVPVSSVDPQRAAELGIANLQAPVLSLSGVDISLPNLGETASNDFGARVGRAYEGTLGYDLFAGVVMEIDYARQTVRIYDPAGYRYSGGGKNLPLKFYDGMPVVRAKVDVNGRKSAEALFVLNTALGASLVLSDAFAQQHHLFSSHMKTIAVGPGELNVSGNAVVARIQSFQMGPYNVEMPLATFAQAKLPGDGDKEIAGEIGGGMLRRFTVIFDFVRQEVILEPNLEFRSDDREDMSGISVAASGPGLKTFTITQVRPGTPASSAGIQTGDVIAGVDEEASADMTLDALRGLFRQVGHKYKLLIERNGKTLTVNIQMRRLL
jgi:PDZ domain